MDANGDQSHDLLCFEERLPSSPGFPNSDSYMEYGTYASVTLWSIHLNHAYAVKVGSRSPPGGSVNKSDKYGISYLQITKNRKHFLDLVKEIFAGVFDFCWLRN